MSHDLIVYSFALWLVAMVYFLWVWWYFGWMSADNIFNFVGCSSAFWLLFFAVAAYHLAHGKDESAKEKTRELIIPFLIVAAINTIGAPLYFAIKLWLFS